jgi:hypothetical protein
LVFDSQSRQHRQDVGHATLIVQTINGVLREVVDLDVWELGQEVPMTTLRPLVVPQTVIGDGEQPRQDRLAVKSYVLATPPRFGPDDARQFLG